MCVLSDFHAFPRRRTLKTLTVRVRERERMDERLTTPDKTQDMTSKLEISFCVCVCVFVPTYFSDSDYSTFLCGIHLENKPQEKQTYAKQQRTPHKDKNTKDNTVLFKLDVYH